MADGRFRNAVGDEIADQDVDGEADDGLEVGFSVFESKSLVQEVTQNAPEEVVGSGGNPVTQMEHIVEDEHDSRPEQGVRNAHEDEPGDSVVKFHSRNLISSKTVRDCGGICAGTREVAACNRYTYDEGRCRILGE